MDFSTLKQLSKVYPILVKPFDLFDATTVTDQDIQTKIDSVIQYMNSLGQSNNDTVRSWNKVMQWVMDEGLTDSVNAKIDDMMANGTFNDLLTTLTNSLLGSEVLTTTNQDVKGAINEVKGIADSNTSALAESASKTSWINPDSYSGTDVQKLQSAFDAQQNQNNNIQEIVLTRQYDITGSTILIKRASNSYGAYLKIIGINGGITKNDSGFIFSSDRTGGSMVERFKVQNLKFMSTAGAGTKVFDFDKILELTASNNQYINVDGIAYGSGGNQQSPRFINENIQGGNGYAFDFVNVYDCTIDNVIAEQREAFFIQRSNAPSGGDPNPSGYSSNVLRISNCVIEGFTGSESVIKLGFSNIAIIKGNYFEGNVGVDIDASQNPAYGLTIENNFFDNSSGATTKTCILLPTVAVKSNNESDQYVLIGNMGRGNLYLFDFGGTPDPAIKVISIGNYCGGSNLIKSHPELFDIIKMYSETKSTSTGNTTHKNKNGTNYYNIQYAPACNATSSVVVTVDVGYAIGSTAVKNITIIKSTDGGTNTYPADTNIVITNVAISSTDNTKLTFTLFNNNSTWRKVFLDINIIDY